MEIYQKVKIININISVLIHDICIRIIHNSTNLVNNDEPETKLIRSYLTISGIANTYGVRYNSNNEYGIFSSGFGFSLGIGRFSLEMGSYYPFSYERLGYESNIMSTKVAHNSEKKINDKLSIPYFFNVGFNFITGNYTPSVDILMFIGMGSGVRLMLNDWMGLDFLLVAETCFRFYMVSFQVRLIMINQNERTKEDSE